MSFAEPVTQRVLEKVAAVVDAKVRVEGPYQAIPLQGGRHASAWVGKSLVVAGEGVFAEARRRRAGGNLPVVVVSLPRWKAISAGFVPVAGAGQGELL